MTGVLSLNFPEIEKSGLFDRCLAKVKGKKLFFSDQTVLNKYGKKILRLPRKFNEQRQATEGETVVKHFCQGIKWIPFHVYNIKQSEREQVRQKLKIDFLKIYIGHTTNFKQNTLLRKVENEQHRSRCNHRTSY